MRATASLLLLSTCLAWDALAPQLRARCHQRSCAVLVDAPASSRSAHVNRLVTALERAVHDRRRVDELVTLFEYNGQVEAAGQRWEGQGAVKRFFSSVLLENGFTELQVLGEPSSKGDDDAALKLELTGATGDRHEVALLLQFRDGLVRECHLQVPAGAPSLLSTTTDEDHEGPKWETFDGRVRQKIWQRPSCFAPGNTFLKDTMEITTGRLIVAVDQTVWELCEPLRERRTTRTHTPALAHRRPFARARRADGEQMEAWAESVELRLDTVVTPGNEDHKTMETFAFLLDELKRTDPLRRSEPVLAVGGGVLTDTVGFACACWRRGIPWCRMPTTLLGMVDASVGIKVAINYHRKNGVGPRGWSRARAPAPPWHLCRRRPPRARAAERAAAAAWGCLLEARASPPRLAARLEGGARLVRT